MSAGLKGWKQPRVFVLFVCVCKLLTRTVRLQSEAKHTCEAFVCMCVCVRACPPYHVINGSYREIEDLEP